MFNFGIFIKIKDLFDCPISLRFWLHYLSYNVTFRFSVDKTFDVEVLPKFCGHKIFFLDLWRDKPLRGELKLYGGVICIITISLF